MPQYDQFGRRVLSTAAPIEVATGGTGAHDWLVIDAQSSADALLLNLGKPTLVQSIPGGSSFKRFERFYVFGGAGDDPDVASTSSGSFSRRASAHASAKPATSMPSSACQLAAAPSARAK